MRRKKESIELLGAIFKVKGAVKKRPKRVTLRAGAKLLPIAMKASGRVKAAVALATSRDPRKRAVGARVVRNVAAQARQGNPAAAKALAQMRVVNRVKQAQAVAVQDRVARMRQAAATRPAAAQNGVLARLAALEARVAECLRLCAQEPEIAPPESEIATRETTYLEPSFENGGAYDEGAAYDEGEDYWESEESPYESDYNVSGWAYNRPYRPLGGAGAALRSAYRTGLTASGVN